MITKTFHLGDMLTISTGCLVSPTHMDGLYTILNFLTGDHLFTHQLPRAMDECRPHLLRQFPWLEAITAEGVNSATWQTWMAKQVATYGEFHEVAPIPRDDHDQRDPLEELQAMRPDMTIIPVVIEPEDPT